MRTRRPVLKRPVRALGVAFGDPAAHRGLRLGKGCEVYGTPPLGANGVATSLCPERDPLPSSRSKIAISRSSSAFRPLAPSPPRTFLPRLHRPLAPATEGSLGGAVPTTGLGDCGLFGEDAQDPTSRCCCLLAEDRSHHLPTQVDVNLGHGSRRPPNPISSPDNVAVRAACVF